MATIKRYQITFAQILCSSTYEETNSHVRSFRVEATNQQEARQKAFEELAKVIPWKCGTVSLEQAAKASHEDWRVVDVVSQRISSNVATTEQQQKAQSKNAKRKQKRYVFPCTTNQPKKSTAKKSTAQK